jgi:HEAT repeat protein
VALAKLGEPRAIEPMIEILNKTAFSFELEDTTCAAISSILNESSGTAA